MRFWLLVLLMVLLPLRAWAGDAMALAAVESPAGVHCADHATPLPLQPVHGAGGATDRHPADNTITVSNTGDSSTATDSGHLCCDICNGPALTGTPVSAQAVDLPALPGAHPRVAFASTVPRRDPRPPIVS